MATVISGSQVTEHANQILSVIRNVTNLPIDTKENKERFLSQDQPIKGPSKAFFDVAADGQPLGRIEMVLYDDVVPKTAKNFKLLAKGMIFSYVPLNVLYNDGSRNIEVHV